jgi:two-component system cell cycle sensor histidine kinase/response regulator CckA
MGLATGNYSQGRAARSAGDGELNPCGSNHALLENGPFPQSRDHEHLQIIARATNDAVRDWDIKSGALSWPQGLESLLGYCPSSTEGQIGFWQEQVHPEDYSRTAASIADALAGANQHWSGEYRFRRADGSYLQLLERALIIRDCQGNAVRFVGSLMDVTTRKQLHDQLCRSQKMEAFGQLAGGVAHDFNNFLTTILGYSDLVLAETGRKGVVADHVAEIRAAAGRAAVLTGHLLAFSRRQALEPRVVEVNSVISNLERSLLRLIGENIHVICHLHDEKQGAHIKVDPGQLTQLILNLAVNARDAMQTGGQLLIETSVVDVRKGAKHACASEDLSPGPYVLISIGDTGIGMSDEVKAHLFEPFFTTKVEARGSGLGLATSYGIVRQSGGHIGIESELAKGTTVRIYFPKVSPPPAPSYKKQSAKKLPRGSETILVLEDDVSVRHISVRVLRSLGYHVIEAANGDDAQRLISEQDSRTVHLLLTDMVMPQMSGRRFADWLRSASPQIKVVFISGYLEESLHPGDRLDAGMFFLPKPFDPEQLAVKVRDALDG